MPVLDNGLRLQLSASAKFFSTSWCVARPAKMIGGRRRISHNARLRSTPTANATPRASARSVVSSKSPLYSRTTTTFCQACNAVRRRAYATSTFQSEHEPTQDSGLKATPKAKSSVTDLAVLGGGITGLATALAAAKNIPDAKVTLYEKTDNLGGWLRSTKVDVGDGEVIFEAGPRSLRPAAPNGELSLRLVESLGMLDELLITSRSSPAAQNRFIYYPDHLVRMPGPGQTMFGIMKTIWSEPAFDGAIRGLWNGLTTPVGMQDIKDESVGAYVSRRFGMGVTENLVSALFHGIYAGDIWQLSAKEIIAQPWAQEKKFGDMTTSMLNSMLSKVSWRFCDDVDLLMKVQQGGWDPALRNRLQDCSVFTFKDGLQALADGIVRKLRTMDNVTMKTNTTISALATPDSTGHIALTAATADGTTHHAAHSHIISTLPSPATAALVSAAAPKPKLSVLDAAGLRALAATRATSVAVVNLYFRTPDLLRSVTPPGGLPASLGPAGLQGFGYLLPRSVPFEQNPERALGVIFDSDVTPDLRSSVPRERRGTRLTVMLGGHWWDGWDAVPSEPEAVGLALATLARHLGITEEPVVARASVHADCIPQYTVGHGERMGRAHEALQGLYAGRLKVAGSWYTGVGVNDCVRAAHEVVEGMLKGDARERTGLERFAWGRPMAMVRRAPQGVLEVLKVDELGARQGYFRGVKVEDR